MAKVTHAARNHALRLKSARLAAYAAKKGNKKVRGYKREEELGDDPLSQIPIIGGLLSGLLGGGGGGGGGDQKSGDSGGGGAMAMAPAPGGGGISLADVRGVVQDALAAFGGGLSNKDNLRQTMATQARGAVDAVSAALDPTLRQARGGTQVQRLQQQATSEHNVLQRNTARRQQEDDRDTRINQKLDRLVSTVAAIQSRLGGRTAVVTDPMMQDILNVR